MSGTSEIQPRLYDQPTARRLLGEVSDSVMRRLIKSGQLRGVRIGRRVKVDAASIDKFLERVISEGGRD